MSALIQILIALTMMMPPGSYRSLQRLAGRAKGAAIEPSAAGGNAHRVTSRASSLRSNAPRIPPRARDWSKVTFTHEDSWAGPVYTLAEPAIGQLPLGVDIPTGNGVERRYVGPPRLAHATPRAALLALHRLLT